MLRSQPLRWVAVSLCFLAAHTVTSLTVDPSWLSGSGLSGLWVSPSVCCLVAVLSAVAIGIAFVQGSKRHQLGIGLGELFGGAVVLYATFEVIGEVASGHSVLAALTSSGFWIGLAAQAFTAIALYVSLRIAKRLGALGAFMPATVDPIGAVLASVASIEWSPGTPGAVAARAPPTLST